MENIEGFYLSDFELVLNQMGIRSHNVYVVSILNGHIDYRVSGIVCSDSSAIRVTGCAIKHAAGTSGNAFSSTNCKDIVVSNSSFYGPGDGANLNANAVAIGEYMDEPSEMTIIANCTFQHFPDQGIWLRTGTSANRIVNNVYTNIGDLNVFDQGLDNVVD
ncbi:MAG: right-handed parallel beta-helix repeat-containing protein [Gammaproteobacteria bacterium]